MTQFSNQNNPLTAITQPRPQDIALRNSIPSSINRNEIQQENPATDSNFMSQLNSDNGLKDPTPEQQAILDDAKEAILAMNQKILMTLGVDPTYFGLDGAELEADFQQAQIDQKKKEKKETGGETGTPKSPQPTGTQVA
jgi:hypothetical protein